MTDEQWRTPPQWVVQTHTHGPEAASECQRLAGPSGPSDDLFTGVEPQQRPHPNYLAKSAIWRDHSLGVISLAEAQRRSAALDEAQSTAVRHNYGPGQPRPPVARPRSTRPAPGSSRQYSNPMATTAARDDRLTPQAKALLQVIRARAGKGIEAIATKVGLAGAISRSTRSIARYLRDLERCGYIQTEIRRDRRGYHLGLTIKITQKVLPFFAETKALARWLGETTGSHGFMPFAPPTSAALSSAKPSGQGLLSKVKGMTLLSPKNQTPKDSSYKNQMAKRELAEAERSPPD